MMQIIKYNGQDITGLFRAGKWAHPVTGVKYPSNWDASTIDGVTVEEVAETPPSIETLKNNRWSEIKELRDGKIQNGGYEVGGKWFHSDTFSRTQQIGLVMLGASIPAGLQWKTMDGSFVTMTQTLAGQIFGKAALNDTLTFANAEAHRLAINALNDATAIANYNITTGWPATYQS